MHSSRIALAVPGCLLLVALTPLPVHALQSGIEQDYLALKTLYESTDGGNWTNNTEWDTTLTGSQISAQAIDNFYGVTVVGGRVAQLALQSNSLAGPIPSELGDLANLTGLFLYINALTGPLPPELGNLVSLERLLVDQNSIMGPIPAELGNLTSLKQLNLSMNAFSEPIPPELGDLARLELLNICQNNLSGPIPAELGNLVSLNWLELSDNALSGPIPAELGNLVSLNWLGLSDNALLGPIPGELGNLVKLNWLELSDNALSGPIPGELGNLAKLNTLQLKRNALSGPIPAELGNLVRLNWLELSDNALSGPIPAELGNLVNLIVLRLNDNVLSGPVPPDLGGLTDLNLLGLYGNNFTGTIPSELGDLAELRWLFLHSNRLSGPIPPELGNLSKLDSLDLYDNGLTGTIPSEMGNLSSLRWLSLSDNDLTGNIPSRFGNLTNLLVLYLDNNALSGAIPLELGNLEELEWLRLSANNLTGSVPSEFGNLTKLIGLYLENNALTGTLPLSLTQILPNPSGPLLYLSFGGSGEELCAPLDSDFQTWLNAINTVIGPNCRQREFAEGVADQAYVVGQAVVFEFPDAASAAPPVTYTLTPDPPAGLTYDGGNRTLSGTPTTVTAPATYTYKVVDATPSADSLQFTIEVVSQMTLPDSIPAQTYTGNEDIKPLVFPAAQGGAPPYSYSLRPDPPSGLTFDASTRTLSGTPNATMPLATYTFAAMDSIAQKDSSQFTIEVLSGLGTARGEVPTAFTLQGNYPNPFQQSTQIVFDLPWHASVSVDVLDMLGRCVLSMPARAIPAGWGRSIDVNAAAISSGTYLYRLRLNSPAGTEVHLGRFVRIR